MKQKTIIVVCAFLATFSVGYFAFFQGGDEVVANQVTTTTADQVSPPDESGDQERNVASDPHSLRSDSGNVSKREVKSDKQGGHSSKLDGKSNSFADHFSKEGRGNSAVGKLLVYVTGAVADPGLYEVPAHSTVGDVVKAAGGLLRFADTESINLAQGAESGTHIHIPFAFTGTPEELLRAQRLNINTATEEELVSIRGIGPTVAKKIVDYRKEKGNFQTVDDLTKIKGIGPALLKKIHPFITT